MIPILNKVRFHWLLLTQSYTCCCVTYLHRRSFPNCRYFVVINTFGTQQNNDNLGRNLCRTFSNCTEKLAVHVRTCCLSFVCNRDFTPPPGSPLTPTQPFYNRSRCVFPAPLLTFDWCGCRPMKQWHSLDNSLQLREDRELWRRVLWPYASELPPSRSSGCAVIMQPWHNPIPIP